MTAKRRLRTCVENWPGAATGEYHPSCCRFPKSCSATVYDEQYVTEDDLEPEPLAWHWAADGWRACNDCGAEVWVFDGGLICSTCGRQAEEEGA